MGRSLHGTAVSFRLLAGSMGLLLSACGGSTEQSGNPNAGGAAAGATAASAGGTTSAKGGSTAVGGQANQGTGGATATPNGGTGNLATGGATATPNGGTGNLATGGATATPNGGTGNLATGGAAAGTAGKATGGKASGGQSGGLAGSPTTGGQATGGTGGISTCGSLNQMKSSRAARSAGFSGTYQANYYPLYSASCSAIADCQTACVQAGGTTLSCASSECIDSTPDYCLPPTFWFDLDRLRIEGNSVDDSAWITMVNNPYRDQLIVSDFQFEIPTNATIAGIAVSMNRSADSTNAVADFEVKLVRADATVGLDRASTTAWPASFQYANYGGASDLWGSTWTAADVNATSFGAALTPMYLDTGGNARAYMDFVRATVYYNVPCP